VTRTCPEEFRLSLSTTLPRWKWWRCRRDAALQQWKNCTYECYSQRTSKPAPDPENTASGSTRNISSLHQHGKNSL